MLVLFALVSSTLLAALAWLPRARRALADAVLVLFVTMSLAASGASPVEPSRHLEGRAEALGSRAVATPPRPTRACVRASLVETPTAIEPRTAELVRGGAPDGADASHRSSNESKRAGFDPRSLPGQSSSELARASRDLDAPELTCAQRAPRSASRGRPRARAPPAVA